MFGCNDLPLLWLDNHHSNIEDIKSDTLLGSCEQTNPSNKVEKKEN